MNKHTVDNPRDLVNYTFRFCAAVLLAICFSGCLQTPDFMSSRRLELDARIQALFGADMNSNRILVPGVMEKCFGVEIGVTREFVISKLIAKSKLSDEVAILNINDNRLVFLVLGCAQKANDVWIKHSYVFVFDQNNKLARTGVNVQSGPVELLRVVN